MPQTNWQGDFKAVCPVYAPPRRALETPFYPQRSPQYAFEQCFGTAKRLCGIARTLSGHLKNYGRAGVF